MSVVESVVLSVEEVHGVYVGEVVVVYVAEAVAVPVG